MKKEISYLSFVNAYDGLDPDQKKHIQDAYSLYRESRTQEEQADMPKRIDKAALPILGMYEERHHANAMKLLKGIQDIIIEHKDPEAFGDTPAEKTFQKLLADSYSPQPQRQR